MRKLILIKHASPLVDPTKSSEHWHLSDKGKESSTALADALKPHDPTIIIASEEPKARETAELVASRLSIPAQVAKNLHEHDRSNVPHMRSGEFISHMELFFRRPSEKVLGKETADQTTLRIEDAVQSILAQHPTGNLAIVTHGTVLALFLARHSDHKGFELWREMGLPSFAVIGLADLEVEDLVRRVG